MTETQSLARQGWARALLLAEIKKVALILLAFWQVVIIVLLMLTAADYRWHLLLGHVVMLLLILAALRRESTFLNFAVVASAGGLAISGMAANGSLDSVLTFAACWQINIASCVAGLVIRKRAVIPSVILGTLAIAAVVLFALPDWGLVVPAAFVITQSSIVVAIYFGLPKLVSIADIADVQEARTQQVQHQRRMTRQISTQIADDQRMLHDTAINTLGAIANEAVNTSSDLEIRRQCEHDLRLLEALRAGKNHERQAHFSELFAFAGLRVHRSGLDDGELQAVEFLLGGRLVSGMYGAALEALNNARKHAGVDQVSIHTAISDQVLTVRIQDLGQGFAGDLPSGRGLERSIMQRAAVLGFNADVQSQEGAGTVVILSATLDGQPGPEAPAASRLEASDPAATIAKMRQRAALLWSLGTALVSVVLSTSYSFTELKFLIPMCLLMLGCWAAAWSARSSRIPAWILAAFGTSTVLVFLLSAAATGFGATAAWTWQALAPTSTFVLLSLSSSSRPLQRCTVWIWAASAIAASLYSSTHSFNNMLIVLVAALVGLGFSFVWLYFLSTIAALMRATAENQATAFRLQLEIDADKAAQNTYKWWIEAGFDRAIALLAKIADGTLRPNERGVQISCSEEENYLRQLLGIGPELVHLGPKLLPIIRSARELGIDFTVQLGTRDVRDAEAAEQLAGALRGCLDSFGPHARIRATVFPLRGELQLTIIATPAEVAPSAETSGTPASVVQHLYPASI